MVQASSVRALAAVLGGLVAGFGGAAACLGDDPDAVGVADAGTDGDAPSSVDGGDVPPGPVVSDLQQSGTRLIANFRALPDGQKEFVDWWDSKLLVHCDFGLQPDGSWRCVPKATEALAGSNILLAGCQDEAYWFQRGCAKIPTYVSEGSCPPAVFTHGPATSTGIWQREGGGCVLAQTTGVVVPKQAAVPATAWAAGSLEPAPEPDGGSPGAVRAMFVRGEDGAYGFHHWELRTVPARCNFLKASFEEIYRCRPEAAAGTIGDAELATYTDDRCTERYVGAAESVPCGHDPQPKVAFGPKYARNVCGWTTTGFEYFLFGGAFEGETYHVDATSGACVKDSVAQIGSRAGRAIPLDELGSVTALPVDPAPPLAGVYGALPDGSRVRLGWRDKAHDTACAFALAEDGVVRCLPPGSAAGIVTVYTDAACSTSPIKVARVAHDALKHQGGYLCDPGSEFYPACLDGGVPCDHPPKPRYAVESLPTDSCSPPKVRVHELGAERTSGFYYRPLDLGCVAYEKRRAEAYFDITPIDAAQFVEGPEAYP